MKKVSLFLSVLVIALSAVRIAPAAEKSDLSDWYITPGLGLIMFEGDEEVEDGLLLSLRLGNDYSEFLSFEGGIFFAPKLDENFVGHTELDGNGDVVKSRISQSDKDVAGFGDTYALGLTLDVLYHFTRWERLDPFLALGLGTTFYGEDFGNQVDVVLRGGGGVMYHFNDVWALRIDGRMLVAGDDTEANAIIDAGVMCHWGASVIPIIDVEDGDDPDKDGLTNAKEAILGTDPYDADTDDDGLLDGEEVNIYKTNPLVADTDLDLLSDGDEVKIYRTDPLNRDTDGGGVSDGHEVLTDFTDPLDGSDDLLMVELNILFDTDKAVIKPVNFAELDIIGKVIKRHTKSTAVIEGHADRRFTSKAGYNKKLSQRRADAVVEYLAVKHGIERSRLKAVGFGFEQPKVAPDLKNGTPENRRVDVYIRNAQGSKKEFTGNKID